MPLQMPDRGVPDRGALNWPLIAALVAGFLLVLGVGFGAAALVFSDTPPRTAAAAGAPATTQQASLNDRGAADRVVCGDLNTRGGPFYSLYVIKVMGGDNAGRRTVGVEPVTLQRSINSLKTIGQERLPSGLAALPNASPEITQEGRDMVAAARDLQLFAGTDATALLTSFVGLSTQCSKQGFQPTWFNPSELTG